MNYTRADHERLARIFADTRDRLASTAPDLAAHAHRIHQEHVDALKEQP